MNTTKHVNTEELEKLTGIWNEYRQLQQKEAKGEALHGESHNYWREHRGELDRFAALRRHLDEA